MAAYVMSEVTAAEIVKLISDYLKIPCAEEYFTEVQPPYAVVLTPEAKVFAPDMGGCYARTQGYRIELYTKSKADPLRDRFKDLIYSVIPAGDFIEEEQSYRDVRLYLTAVEFTI